MKQFLMTIVYVAIICLSIPSMVFAQAVVSIDPPAMESPAIGEQFTVNINITGGENVVGYQVTVTFDPTALTYITPAPAGDYNGDFLSGAFAVGPDLATDRVTLAATTFPLAPTNGDGALAKVTFEVVAVKNSTIGLADVKLIDPAAEELPVTTADGQITGLVEAVRTEQEGESLSVEAKILEANTAAKCFIALGQVGITVEAGMFLEYQVKFSSISPHNKGGAYAHTADGTIFGIVDDDAGTEWKHRQVPLDSLVGQQIDTITVGTDNGENPNNPAGTFSMMIDNVQITNGAGVVSKVWVGENSINGKQEETETFGGIAGVENCKAFISSVAVQAKEKLMATWGHIKATK